MDGENENLPNDKKKEFKLEINFDDEQPIMTPEPGIPEVNETAESKQEDVKPEGNKLQADSQSRVGSGSALAGPKKSNKKKLPKGCLRVGIYASIVLIISVMIAVFLISTINDVLGLYKPDKQVDLEIPQGSTATQITGMLKKNGIIRSKLVFKFYLKSNKVTGFQYGDFMLNTNMGYAEIIKELTSVNSNRSIVKVTIPEGYTMQQIANALEKNNVCTAKSFITACQQDNFKFAYSSAVPNDKNRFYRLEGYLFPDTYNFYQKCPPHTVAQKMLDNFSEKFTKDMADKAKQMNLTIDQTITLASIIQAEAGKKSQMAKVSSVFHNRLGNGQGSLKYLQSDATVFYAFHTTNNGQKADITIKSPYNTYLNTGLTPGAINNPGVEAINAALNPAKTNYYYFVSDVNGEYHYSTTFAQHQQAVLDAKKKGTAKGTNISGSK